MRFNRNSTIKTYAKAGDWILSPELRVLSNGIEADLILNPRLATLSYVLLKQANKIVSNEELIHCIWDNSDINANSLKETIYNLQNELNAHFKNPPKIIQVRNNGYRMLVKTTFEKNFAWKYILRYSLYFLLIFTLIILLLLSFQY